MQLNASALKLRLMSAILQMDEEALYSSVQRSSTANGANLAPSSTQAQTGSLQQRVPARQGSTGAR